MKIVLFDFFGVLSSSVYSKLIREIIRKEDQQTWIKKLDEIDLGNLSEEELIAQFSEYSKISEKEIQEKILAAPQIDYDLINYIKNELKSKFSIGLLTNAPRFLIERILKENLNIFEHIFISSDFKLIKPHPEIFEYVIAKLNYDLNKITFIDDRKENITAAINSGINGYVYKELSELKKYLTSL